MDEHLIVTITGKWKLIAEAMGQPFEIIAELIQYGDTFTGTLSSMLGIGTIDGGEFIGNQIHCSPKISFQGKDVELKMVGTVEGDSMKGTLSSPLGEFLFTATRS